MVITRFSHFYPVLSESSYRQINVCNRFYENLNECAKSNFLFFSLKFNLFVYNNVMIPVDRHRHIFIRNICENKAVYCSIVPIN